ncbi:phosphate/phosphite/phosphonate ABC transporter substrate-binding protein [Spirillospora sp. NPDC029432]|uniref:phosphate/phosphite/phosphonate ABC transporter substrate-binding protein n=1 Tax=Spirillospora sp. NPDC029432 TaxID=3154599 RepID=UPI003452C4A8
MTRFTRAALLAGAAAAALTACGSSAASDDDAGGLTFAAVPSEQNIDPNAEYEDIIGLIEKNTGRKVTFVRSTDYNAVIEGMVSGKIDIAEFGPLSYVLARANGAKITPVAAMVEKGEAPTYHSYGVVPKDSTITSLAGFKGKKVCFVDPSSTSGYLFPSAGLQQAGVDPRTGVKPVMAGGHDSSALSVKDGKCDAGFSLQSMVDSVLPAKKELARGDLKAVWKSPAIPASPIAIRTDLPGDVRAKLTSTFTRDANKDRMVALGVCEDAASCKVTSDPSYWGYQAIDDKAFDPVRQVCAATRNDKCSKAA